MARAPLFFEMLKKMTTIVIHDQEVVSLLEKHDILTPHRFEQWLLQYLKVHDLLKETMLQPIQPGTPDSKPALTAALMGVVTSEVAKMKEDVSCHISNVQKVYSETLEKLQSAWNDVSSNAGNRTVQELSVLQERVNKMSETVSSSYTDVNCKLDSILGKSGATSSIKGETAESIYTQSLLREFPEAIVADVSKKSHMCDIQIDRQPNQPRIFIELKHYTQPVPTLTIKKFESDMSHYDKCGGIFVSATSSICGKTAFHIETKGSNVLVFISNAGLVDVKCIRHAIQAIDILLELMNMGDEDGDDENCKNYTLQLDEEQVSLITNEVRMYDQRQMQIVATLQHVISDIKAQSLSVIKRIIADRAITSHVSDDSNTCLSCNRTFKQVSNLHRHLKNGSCPSKKSVDTLVVVAPAEAKLAQEFFNEEMEISTGYGCVNSGPLKKHFEKWCVTNNRPIPKVDIKILFDDVLGSESWSTDGTCGRVYTSDQLKQWTGKKFTDPNGDEQMNLRVHNGWRGYKLKNSVSCELKRSLRPGSGGGKENPSES